MKKLLVLLLALMMTISLAACASGERQQESTSGQTETTPEETTSEKTANGEVAILFTSDIHCGIDKGFGLAGLKQVRDELEAKGYTTILVDDGDAVQGESIGTITKGEEVIKLMNEMHYDVAIPGNHEFDYGMEQFFKLVDMAEFEYISCNFNKEGEMIFKPYKIIEAAGMKIAFVGVTTPHTITTSTPRFFQDENGNYIYGFLQDSTGEALYSAVQKAVDDARAEGADYVYVMGHIGIEESLHPYNYADIISNTTGIDVFLDGHSHDTEQVVMKNKNGESVVRSACGTKMNCIGYSFITSEGIKETNIWSWPNTASAPELLGIHNEISEKVDAALKDVSEQLNEVVARTDVELTINDPVAKDDSGNPIRMVRRAETNLGDLCADAIRAAGGADIGLVNGGGVRVSIKKGDITYNDIISVFPFGNYLCVVEATGQQILDALEFGAKAVPDENGAFLQVSGLSYEIDVNVPSGIVLNENNMMVGIEGERRVKNVMVGDEPIDPTKIYTVASTDYLLISKGDGNTAFDGATLTQDKVKLDSQLLIEYLVDNLGGTIGEGYTDPYGQGRIKITE